MEKFVRTPYKYLVTVPEDKEDLVKLYIEICKGTERSAASRIIEFIEEDLENLEVENLEVEKKSVKLVCGFCNKEFVSGALARFVSGVRMLSCESCLKDRYDKRLVRSILREYH